jgi:hypothetical protein
VEKVKKILKDDSISDEKAENIRNEFYALAEIIYEKWLKDKRMKNKQ